MLVFTFRWPALLCMVTIFLGWLAPATLARETKTSEVYKVLKDSDQMGGSCTSRMSQVDQLIPEVQQLIDAAVDALDNLLKDPNGFRRLFKSKMLDRKRLLNLGREFLGVEWEEKSFKVKGENTATGKNSKKTLTDFRYNFNELRKTIQTPDQNNKYRFACDDTWVEKIKELPTDYDVFKKGTSIIDIVTFNSAGTRDWAFFDRGGPTERPNEDNKEIQQSWYIGPGKDWAKDGPCAPRLAKERSITPYAETLPEQNVIYFCKRTWEQAEKDDGKLKGDLRKFKNAKISTDGKSKQYLDDYMSPGAVFLHEMTHQILNTGDGTPKGLGYNHASVIEGKNKPQEALKNADTYPYFAVAAYFSQVEWHSGRAQEIK